jgi:hypothetical protein
MRRFVLDGPRQFPPVARMLTTIKAAGIDSAYSFPNSDAHDSTRQKEGMSLVYAQFGRGEREQRVHDL